MDTRFHISIEVKILLLTIHNFSCKLKSNYHQRYLLHTRLYDKAHCCFDILYRFCIRIDTRVDCGHDGYFLTHYVAPYKRCIYTSKDTPNMRRKEVESGYVTVKTSLL